MSAPRVLVARLDNDGDVLLAGPAIRAIAADAAHVTLLCGPRGQRAAALLPGVDELIVHRAEWIDPEPEPFDPEPSRALVERIRALAPDEAVIFTSFHQSPLPLALLLRFAGVPRIGATSVDYPGSLLDVRHRISDDVHEVERGLALAEAMGHRPPPGDDLRLRIRRPAREGVGGGTTSDGTTSRGTTSRGTASGDTGGGDAGRGAARCAPYVVVHPGASVSARAWAPERHAELVAALLARGRRVLVTGGPDERALTRSVVERATAIAAGSTPSAASPAPPAASPASPPPTASPASPPPSPSPLASPPPSPHEPAARVRDLGGETSFAELAEVIAGADAIVVGNTGPAHLAAAVGTPVVSIYAPTVPAVRWRPWQVPHVLLHTDVPCAGCRARSCPVPGHPCVEDLLLGDVLAALERLAPSGPAGRPGAAEPNGGPAPGAPAATRTEAVAA